MSYANGLDVVKLDVNSAAGQSITTTGDKLFYAPPKRMIIRQMVVTVTTATTAADPCTIALEHRPTAGSDAGRIQSGIPTVTIPGGSAAGTVWYKANLSYEVDPGEQIVVDVTDASAAGAASIAMVVEWSPQVPGNFAIMTASA